jgi:hypothetical protein
MIADSTGLAQKIEEEMDRHKHFDLKEKEGQTNQVQQ